MRYILNKIGATARKRYDYDLLEKTYLELLKSDVDDTSVMRDIASTIGNKKVLVIVPGSTATTELPAIEQYIKDNNPIVITVNFLHDSIESDFIYMSNVKRYRYWRNNERFISANKILTSNISAPEDEKNKVVSFVSLIKCGWEHLDNSTIMLLRLLDNIGVSSIAIAGFDGYDVSSDGKQNYASKYLELSSMGTECVSMNQEIKEMLEDYNVTRVNKNTEIKFITPSRFEACF